MAIYSLGLRSTVSTDNVAAWGFLAPSTQNSVVTELMITNAAAVHAVFGLGRAAAAGTQTSGIAVSPAGVNDTTNQHSTCAVAWSAAPTVPTAYNARGNLGAVLGDPLIFLFPRGLTVAASGELVLWNVKGSAGSTAFDVNVTCDE